MPEVWLKKILLIGICIGVGLFLQWLFFKLLEFGTKKKPTILKEQTLKWLKTPSTVLVPLLFIFGALHILELKLFWKILIEIGVIINLTWLIIAFLQAVEAVVKQKFQVSSHHKAKERKALTQLRFLKSLFSIIVITLAIASILWSIPQVRKIGTTLLTSAGVFGIIVGVAAQKSIANLITGFQVAFTQPIKIDDEVVIEGEFGIVEDITLTYVVVKTWDWRRLVLPLNYFNDKPFVNWTFNSSDIIGSVFLYVDYTFPVKDLRQELTKILNKYPQWDKKNAELLVTKSTQKTMELRATFSAKNATDIWSLRCAVREELIGFIQDHYPASLPKLRCMDVFKI